MSKTSLILPFFSLAVPLVWSARPSAFLSLLPVREPAASFARPLAVSSAPSFLSWLLLLDSERGASVTVGKCVCCFLKKSRAG